VEVNVKPKISNAILGGFAGTAVMTLMLYMVAPMMGVRMDIAGSLGKMLGGSWTLGLVMHFINGSIIFPLIYALMLYRVLPDGPIGKGIAWGVALWLIAQLMVIPMMGGGLFSSKMGGMMAAGGSLVNHVLYGGVLGWIAGPKATSAQQEARPKAA
jgi:hypothetical protein